MRLHFFISAVIENSKWTTIGPLRLFKDHTDMTLDDYFYFQLRKRFVSHLHHKDSNSVSKTPWMR